MEERRATAHGVPAKCAAAEHRSVGRNSIGTSKKKLCVDAKDFLVEFDPQSRVWTVAWKWADGAGPPSLKNTVAQYSVNSSARELYDEELETWLENGWLQPYDETTDGC